MAKAQRKAAEKESAEKERVADERQRTVRPEAGPGFAPGDRSGTTRSGALRARRIGRPRRAQPCGHPLTGSWGVRGQRATRACAVRPVFSPLPSPRFAAAAGDSHPR